MELFFLKKALAGYNIQLRICIPLTPRLETGYIRIPPVYRLPP